jgi:3D (Asp-Asp-Asp) domain-containing protein
VLGRSRAVIIRYPGGELETVTAAATVGQALSDSGIALQGMDYSLPADNQPIPQDGIIRVVRVREEILLEQASIPYTNEYVPDPELQLDSTRILVAGQPGIEVSRLRVRYEDGQETARVSEATWVASQPTIQQVAYGTKIVIMTKQTPNGPIEYWRSVRVYATSFAPCKYSNGTRCSWSTASGIRLTTGVVAVPLAWWYLGMSRQLVYVDNYGPGIIGDTGGMTGHWIDLGYDDANYVGWYSYTTIYFLTPVPANVPWILP